jgi:hypothetical protein
MSVAAGTETVTEDITHLDWNEHRACEHPTHIKTEKWHEDGDEQWVRTNCPDCRESHITIRCLKFLNQVAAGLTVFCDCGRPGGMEFYHLLGPANGDPK